MLITSGTVTISSCTISGNSADYTVRAHAQDFPSPPWEGDSHFARCLQGGGVFVGSGVSVVIISSCTISGNTAKRVRAHAQNFPSPPWETHVWLLVCRAVVLLSSVALWPSHRAPSVGTQLAECALMFKISHRPDGKIADVLASTHACKRFGQLQSVRAAETSKTSHGPMGKWLTCLP